MEKKKLSKRLVYLIFFILLANFLANRFFWYYSIWYFDMIMHFLGGFWIGLASVYLFSHKNSFQKLVFKILSVVFLIGVGWEIFEIIVNNITTQTSFDYLDTISDIFFDLSGGALAIFYFYKRMIIERINEVQ